MMVDNLAEVLRDHELWWESGGERGRLAILKRANLQGANLEGANLEGANLEGANLEGANLKGADLWRADLQEANLTGINLEGANLEGANLKGADLRKANLQWADLRLADLKRVNLHEANLKGADLRKANLQWADLRLADLKRVNLKEAVLWEADLRGASLEGIKYNHRTIGIHPAPEGDLIVWGKKEGVLVKMLVPKEAKRSCATSRKFRAEYVKVLEVIGAEEAVVENEYGRTVYRPGEMVRCHEWDEDRWNECSGGIHFFLTREEAEAW